MSLFVDNTILSAVARCHTQAAIRHVAGLTSAEESADLRAGSAAHLALAAWLRGEGLGAAREAFATDYAEFSERVVERGLAEKPWGARLLFENVQAILERWFETHPLHLLPFTVNPNLVEVPFQVPLDDNGDVIFCGTMDAVVSDDSGSLFVLDHKTTGRLDPSRFRKYKIDSQMSGYVWAAQETLGQTVTGVYINAIEFSKLPSSPKLKCTKVWGNNQQPHGTTYSECGAEHMKCEVLQFHRTEAQLASWRKDALQWAREYAELQQTNAKPWETSQRGTWSGDCYLCNFKDFCETGRSPATLTGGLYTEERWNPAGKR